MDNSLPASLGSADSLDTTVVEGITRPLKVFFYDVSINNDYHLGASYFPELLKRLPELQLRGEPTTHYINNGRIGVTISAVARNPIDNVTTFRILKGRLDKSSEAVVNLRTRSVVPLDEKMELEEDEGIGYSVICCFDHKNSVLAIYSTRSPSIGDVEGYFTQYANKFVQFILIKDPDAERVFETMDVKKLTMKASIPRIEKFAPEFTGEPAGVPKRQIELIDFTKRFNGGRVVIELTADREDAISYLRKDAIREEVGALRRLMQVGRRKNQAIVQGKVELDNKVLNGRVVDLIDGLLIWQDEVKLPTGIEKSLESLEEHITRAVIETRSIYEERNDR